MEWTQVIVLALVQGITEFLPVSSSAHLILVPQLTGWGDQGLAFDVAVHLGSLIAVVSYFRDSLWEMAREWWLSLRGGAMTPRARLVWAVGVGTVPVGLVGWGLGGVIEAELRSPMVIATTTLLFGLLLWWSDRSARQALNEYQMGWRQVAVIAVAQALALIPGTSRSGITITAGLMMGLDRGSAARFSFLLSIPVILLAAGLKGSELITSDIGVNWVEMAAGVLLSAVSAYLCIHLFLQLLQRLGMFPFVIYRLLLGVGLLILYGGSG